MRMVLGACPLFAMLVSACGPSARDEGPPAVWTIPKRTPAPTTSDAGFSEDVEVTLSEQAFSIVQGASLALHVNVKRTSGAKDTLSLAVTGLPNGLTTTVISTEANEADVPLVAAPSTAQGRVHAMLEVSFRDRKRSIPFELFVRGSPGSRDTTFGSSGIHEIASGSSTGALVLALDDSLFAVHGCPAGACVRRLTKDGLVDPSYGVSGTASMHLELGVSRPVFATLAASGALVVASDGSDDAHAGIGKIDPAGFPDSSFGTSAFGPGTMRSPFPSGMSGIEALANGDVVVGGVERSSPRGGYDLRRYDASGFARTTFGDRGGVTLGLRTSPHDGVRELGGTPWGMGLRNDGDIFVFGTASEGATSYYGLCEIHGASGAYDETFGVGGRHAVSFVRTGTLHNGPSANVATGPDGEVGAFFFSESSDQYWLTVFEATGFPSVGFGDEGLVGPFPVTMHGRPLAMAFEPGGGLLLLTTAPDPQDSARLIRFSKQGTRDTAFGIEGRIPVDASPSSSFASVAIQHDGRIVTFTTVGESLTDRKRILSRFWNG